MCDHIFVSPHNGYSYCNYPGVREEQGCMPYCRSPIQAHDCPIGLPDIIPLNSPHSKTTLDDFRDPTNKDRGD